MVDIKEFKDVYVPAEDSFLLLRAVKYAYGEVLDMFAGSGIIGLNAADRAEKSYICRYKSKCDKGNKIQRKNEWD